MAGGLADRLTNMCESLEGTGDVSPELVSQLSVEIGKAAMAEFARAMLTRLHAGESEIEVTAACPFALALLVKLLVFCTEKDASPEVVDRLLDTVRNIAHKLGDGDPAKILPKTSPARCH